MNLHQSLKSQTAQIHNEIENELDLMRSNFLLQDYITVLKRFHSFYKSFENSLMESEYSNFIKRRLKTNLLIKDLSFFGIEEEKSLNFSDKQHLPLNTLEQILGALYVSEGSTLGGCVLSQHFSSKFKLSPHEGMSFFHCYGEQTGMFWKEFLEFMEKERKNKSLKEELIIESAHRTFRVLKEWLTIKEQYEQ